MNVMNEYKLAMLDPETDKEILELVMKDVCAFQYSNMLNDLYKRGKYKAIRRFINLELEAELNKNMADNHHLYPLGSSSWAECEIHNLKGNLFRRLENEAMEIRLAVTKLVGES